MAAPSFWLMVATFSVASLMAGMADSSVPSSAFFSSASASSTSALVAGRVALGELVALSARNFSVW
jgi:hypothetical protein